MKRAAIVLTAAALSSVGIVATNLRADSPTTTPSDMQNAQANDTAPDQSSICDVLAKVTNFTLTRHDMDRLVAFLDQPARQTITKSDTFNQGYGDDINNQIKQINTEWTQKFGHEFNMSDSTN